MLPVVMVTCLTHDHPIPVQIRGEQLVMREDD